MPYDNPENRQIARDVSYINKTFIEHTDALGTSQTINYRNPSVSGSGFSGGSNSVIGGGIGCAEWHSNSASKHEKGTHAKCPCGADEDGDCLCGGTNLGFRSRDPVGASLTGGAILGLEDNTILGAKTKKPERKKRNKTLFGSLGNAIPADMGVMAPTMPAASAVRASAIKDSNSPIETLPSKGRGRPRKSHTKDETSSPMKAPPVKKGGNGFASGTHMDTGEGPATLGVKPRRSKKGGSTYNLEDPKLKKAREDNAAKYAKAKSGSGSLRSTSKKGVLRLKPNAQGKDAVTDPSGNPLLPTTTKRTVRSTAKKEVKPFTEKAQLPSSTLSGMGVAGKKPNARAAIVKSVMAEHGLSMIEASKYVKEHNLY